MAYKCSLCGSNQGFYDDNGYFQKMQWKYGFLYVIENFESLNREKKICKCCRALDRDRLIIAFLNRFIKSKKNGIKMLQIAPSRAIEMWAKNNADKIIYESTDLYMENVTFVSDIQDMQNVRDNEYDIVVCSHVLEHVQDDRMAMRELRRILKDDGVCLLLVPIPIGVVNMDEEIGLTEEKNWERFGQNDHVRLYSKIDFVNRLIESGFYVSGVDKTYIGENIYEENALTDDHILYVATKSHDLIYGKELKKFNMDTTKLVSVIIPTYNRGNLIVRSVNSVLSSTYQNLEVIVVDDGSTDDTSWKISQIKDERLRYIRYDENKGANYARNIGIKNSRGEYIAFNDSDDIWFEEKLDELVKYLQSLDESYGMVYGDIIRFEDGKNGELAPHDTMKRECIRGNIFEYMLSNMFISTQTVLIKREVLNEVGLFDEKLKRLQDWELFLRISKKYKVGRVPKVMTAAYVQKDSISKNEKNFVETMLYVIDKYEVAQRYPSSFSRMIMIARAHAEHADEKDRKELLNRIGSYCSIARLEKERSMDNESLMFVSKLIESTSKLYEVEKYNKGVLNELRFANIFNSTIVKSEWWNYSISPGNMAVGYPFLYALYRILDETKPKKILELGLGQSSLMTTAYSKSNEVKHVIVEHDNDWIKFFRGKLHGENYAIYVPNLVINNIENHNIYMYDDLSEIMEGAKYDLLIIDAPFGSQFVSRIDTFDYIPDILEDNFVIMLHDANREGEKNSIRMLENILRENDIKFANGIYEGIADTYVVTSANQRFLCSL